MTQAKTMSGINRTLTAIVPLGLIILWWIWYSQSQSTNLQSQITVGVAKGNSGELGNNSGVSLTTQKDDAAAIHFGHSISIWDDLNGDGRSEVAIGCPRLGGYGSGQVLIMDGQSLEIKTAISSDVLDQCGFGKAMVAVPDRDGDGIMELAVTSSNGFPVSYEEFRASNSFGERLYLIYSANGAYNLVNCGALPQGGSEWVGLHSTSSRSHALLVQYFSGTKVYLLSLDLDDYKPRWIYEAPVWDSGCVDLVDAGGPKVIDVGDIDGDNENDLICSYWWSDRSAGCLVQLSGRAGTVINEVNGPLAGCGFGMGLTVTGVGADRRVVVGAPFLTSPLEASGTGLAAKGGLCILSNGLDMIKCITASEFFDEDTRGVEYSYGSEVVALGPDSDLVVVSNSSDGCVVARYSLRQQKILWSKRILDLFESMYRVNVLILDDIDGDGLEDCLFSFAGFYRSNHRVIALSGKDGGTLQLLDQE